MNRFEKWFNMTTKKAEKVLFKLALIAVLLLFAVQVAMSNPVLRRFLSYPDRLEGEEYDTNMNTETTFKDKQEENYYLELKITGEPNPLVSVLINKRERAAFTSERVLLEVSPGDIIEIAGEKCTENTTVTVVSLHKQLKYPSVGSSVTTFSTNELLGWVALK